MIIKTSEIPWHTQLTVEKLYKLILNYDPEIAYHSSNVKKIAGMLTDGLNLSIQTKHEIANAALLHDIGKIMIPKSILDKPSKLTPQEYKIIKEHSLYGYQILGNISGFQHIADDILYHHEFFNGTGYPIGTSGVDIPFISRVLTISDVYEALISDRCYRKALPKVQAAKMIVESSGIQFDPMLVDKFLFIKDFL
ncbi:MAG: HD domain-containing phosphohydrolase [Veillonellales bacterium]